MENSFSNCIWKSDKQSTCFYLKHGQTRSSLLTRICDEVIIDGISKPSEKNVFEWYVRQLTVINFVIFLDIFKFVVACRLFLKFYFVVIFLILNKHSFSYMILCLLLLFCTFLRKQQPNFKYSVFIQPEVLCLFQCSFILHRMTMVTLPGLVMEPVASLLCWWFQLDISDLSLWYVCIYGEPFCLYVSNE